MKLIIAAFIFFWMTTIAPAAEQTPAMYENSVLSEDVTWRGSVLIKGFVVVAPQATLRIDPGTIVRFAAASSQHLSNLVVQGRLHVAGTTDRPVIFTPDRPRPVRGAWGGIVFLSTEKRNVLENCRIEFAETGIDVRFSTLFLKAVSIVQTRTGLLSHDGVIQMTGGSVSESETGIELYDSEFDSKDTSVSSCQRGAVLSKSSVVLATVKVMDNQQTGLDIDECRIKFTGGDFSGNECGARIKGGEGQIVMSRFQRNKKIALQLLGSRLKVQRNLFSDNSQEALRIEDGRSLLLNNSFSSNGGYNLYNAGRDDVGARQNWWGTPDLSLISKKIYDAARDKNVGPVHISPWLNEKPPLMP